MKKYGVMVPFAGHFYIEVEAEDKAHAKELAFNESPFDDKSNAELIELEYFERMNRGNISSCTLSEIDIEEI